MPTGERCTLFAFDSGASKRRLYLARYELLEGESRLVEDPSLTPKSIFTDRHLPAVLKFSLHGSGLERCGGRAQSLIGKEIKRLGSRLSPGCASSTNLRKNLVSLLYFSEKPVLMILRWMREDI